MDDLHVIHRKPRAIKRASDRADRAYAHDAWVHRSNAVADDLRERREAEPLDSLFTRNDIRRRAIRDA